MERLWQVAEIVNNDSKGVLKEHENGDRNLDMKSVERYQGRIYDKLDDKTKDKILKIARNDISNILGAMKPIKNEMVLYRNVRIEDALIRYDLNDIVEFKIISSTSVVPSDPGYDFYRYEIAIPKNGSALELNQFDHFIRNEDDEVLLPPMKCRIKNTHGSNNGKCKEEIELEYLKEPSINL